MRLLFAAHREWLAANTKCDWTIEAVADAWVQVVNAGDPRSTFFRYPRTDRLDSDAVKSPMKEVSEEGFLGQLQQGEALGKRVFSMIVQNHDREFVRGYVHDPTADLAFYDALRKLAEFCYNLHAAMRWELCEGW